MVLVVALPDRVETGNARLLVARRALEHPPGGALFEVDPQPSHRVVHRREDLHRGGARVDPLKLLVDVEDAPELAVECLLGDVRQVEINAEPVLLDRQAFGGTDVEDLPRGDVAGDKVHVFRVALLEKVRSLRLGDCPRVARVLRSPRHPHPAPLAAGAFAHQPELVGPRDGGGVNLDELTVSVGRSGLVNAADRAACADHRHRRAAVDEAAATGGEDHRIGRERAELHRDHVLADRAAAAPGVVDDGGEKVPELVLADLPLDLEPPHLLIEGVEELLTGRGPGEGCPLVEGPTEAALIAESLRCPVERHAEPVHEIDDPRAPVGHLLDRRLVLEEVTAVDGVVEMLPFGIPLLPREGVDAVDPPLSADAVRPLHRDKAHEVDIDSELGEPHRGREPGKTTADNENAGLCHGGSVSCRNGGRSRKQQAGRFGRGAEIDGVGSGNGGG